MLQDLPLIWARTTSQSLPVEYSCSYLCTESICSSKGGKGGR